MENKLYLYFVAFKRDGKIRGLISGPFARAVDATYRIQEIRVEDDDPYVVVRIAVPILDVEVMD